MLLALTASLSLVSLLLVNNSTEINILPRTTTVYAHKSHKKIKWHKGTPKELRGHYKIIRNAKHTLSPKYFWAEWTITEKKVDLSAFLI